MPEVSWFRAPSAEDPGTLNACYHALDLPVVRGRADDVALTAGGTDRTYAWLLTEVAACGGVLKAFGVGVGDEVLLGWVPVETAVVAVLAVARLGGVVVQDDSPGAGARVGTTTGAKVWIRLVDDAPAFTVDGDDLPWDVAMRAGRTDPAACADVPGDAVMSRHVDDTWSVLDALGASEEPPPVTAGARTVEVGGVSLWVLGGR